MSIMLSGQVKLVRSYDNKFTAGKKDVLLLVEKTEGKVNEHDTGIVPIRISATTKEFAEGDYVFIYDGRFTSYVDRDDVNRYEIKVSPTKIYRIDPDTDWTYSSNAVQRGQVVDPKQISSELSIFYIKVQHMVPAKGKAKYTTVLVPCFVKAGYAPKNQSYILASGTIIGRTKNQKRNVVFWVDSFVGVHYK